MKKHIKPTRDQILISTTFVSIQFYYVITLYCKKKKTALRWTYIIWPFSLQHWFIIGNLICHTLICVPACRGISAIHAKSSFFVLETSWNSKDTHECPCCLAEWLWQHVLRSWWLWGWSVAQLRRQISLGRIPKNNLKKVDQVSLRSWLEVPQKIVAKIVHPQTHSCCQSVCLN